MGRDAELSVLTGVLDRLGPGGRAVLIEGQTGVGKTALTETLADEAGGRGLPVLLTGGTGDDSGPGEHAGLHELLHPLLEDALGLPRRQHEALLTALGLAAGPPPDPLLVGLATLGLLEKAAGTGGLLVVAEDVYRLDPESLAAIDFVAGRLSNAPIAILATTRPGMLRTPLFAGREVTLLTLGPLDDDAAGLLLSATAPEIGEDLRRQVLAEAGGNPLAVREFAAEARRFVGRAATPGRLPARLPVSRRLQRAFIGDLASLPAASRMLLLIAAAGDEHCTLPEVVAAAARAGAGPADLSPLERGRLLAVRFGRLTFDHPLVRSAVYSSASLAERAAAHGHLADVVTDPVRAAWHRAAATLRLDETVAGAMEAASGLAQQRGTLREAVAALRRAADLSPGPEDRARRCAAGAEVARQAGLPDEAYALLAEAFSLTGEPAGRAALAAIERTLGITYGTPVRRTEEVVRLAGAGGGKLLTAAVDYWWTVDGSPATARLLAGALDPADEILPAMLDPAAHAGAVRERLPELLASARREILAGDHPTGPGLPLLARCAESVQALAVAQESWELHWRYHPAGNALDDEATALGGRGMLRLLRGELTTGLADAEQALRIAQQSGLTRVAGVAASVAALALAWRGDRSAAQDRLAVSARARDHEPYALITAREAWAAGVLALAGGRYADAWRELTETAAHPTTGLWATADMAEAGFRAERTGPARERCAAAEAQAAALGSDHLWAIVHRARAVLTDGDEAEQAYRQSLKAAEAAGNGFELARGRLAYGEWLRRRRRIIEAREPLRAAFHEFRRIRAADLTERASAELRAAGVTAVDERPAAGAVADLTPQEAQIVRLAATGLSNKEIADRLFLSPRTVGSHLYKAFPKLGVTSRAQLVAALGEDGGEQV
ncbi:helix-turn-helix transcriptional regulator [Paractinoplanes atraurantiacus]|uniref:AAA ATPase domain-containing protein n=1 Tax=Paractinoplanes atraurantiacus TaxID=1036182 RepID=A0A285J194_9ACTN|nr:LuxR family transcriptional regulator [Actinoplanes atraurantiacus]SNY53657.1 AAA ATPase domain-containing protein [Actinoplanes atraurantiacus]